MEEIVSEVGASLISQVSLRYTTASQGMTGNQEILLCFSVFWNQTSVSLIGWFQHLPVSNANSNLTEHTSTLFCLYIIQASSR